MDNEGFRYMLDAVNTKHERTERRLFIIVLILILSLMAISCTFVWYISLPVDEVSSTVEQEANDTTNTQLIGGDFYGEADDKDSTQEAGDQK